MYAIAAVRLVRIENGERVGWDPTADLLASFGYPLYDCTTQGDPSAYHAGLWLHHRPALSLVLPEPVTSKVASLWTLLPRSVAFPVVDRDRIETQFLSPNG